MKLRKGDTVEVITGKDKGKQGEIAFVFPKTNKVIINGVNTAAKHQRPRRANDPGGIIEKDLPIDASNVMYVHKGKTKESRFSPRLKAAVAHELDVTELAKNEPQRLFPDSPKTEPLPKWVPSDPTW